jgi:hypothetical protein
LAEDKEEAITELFAQEEEKRLQELLEPAITR